MLKKLKLIMPLDSKYTRRVVLVGVNKLDKVIGDAMGCNSMTQDEIDDIRKRIAKNREIMRASGYYMPNPPRKK